jgi:hypothetical protein
MRDAIDPCSVERVHETGQENQELMEVFDVIRGLSYTDRELPWTVEQAITRITSDRIRYLEEGGVFFRDSDEYYVPEVYRHGLGFYYGRGARRKVVTLMRRAPAI